MLPEWVLSLETHPTVRTVAKGFISGITTTAKVGGTFLIFSYAILFDDFKHAGHLQWSVGDYFYFEN